MQRRVVEGRSGACTLEGVEQSDGDTRSLRSAANMRINSAGRCSQACQTGGFDAAIRRQAGTPDVPKAGLAESELPIRLDAFVALAHDNFLPKFQRVFGLEVVRLLHRFSEDVEIVNLPKHVLQAFEIVDPRSIVFGQQALDRIAEPL